MKKKNFIVNIILIIAVIAIIGALAITYIVIQNGGLTGFVTSSGTTNVTVSSTTSINFTTNSINWGIGNVLAGKDGALLDTSSGVTTNGTGWTSVTQGFVLENIGNVNLTINLATGLTAATFLGGTNPLYKYNVTDNEAASCTNSTTGSSMTNLGIWYDVNTTSIGSLTCARLRYETASDAIRIDLRLFVPSDSKTGGLNDTMVATATQAA